MSMLPRAVVNRKITTLLIVKVKESKKKFKYTGAKNIIK